VGEARELAIAYVYFSFGSHVSYLDSEVTVRIEWRQTVIENAYGHRVHFLNAKFHFGRQLHRTVRVDFEQRILVPGHYVERERSSVRRRVRVRHV
jgi:hypothetical protein